MKSGYRALAMLIAALPFFTAVSSQASEAKRLRQQCIDECRIEVTTCTTKCASGDCLDSCTRPLDGCINNCRKLHPLQTR
ncbi:MAG TPA: hypothetical protein VIF61_05895 [Methylocystis sp.]